MSDNKKVNKLLGEVSKKYGISKEQLESAAQSGNIENLLKIQIRINRSRLRAFCRIPKSKETFAKSAGSGADETARR